MIAPFVVSKDNYYIMSGVCQVLFFSAEWKTWK